MKHVFTRSRLILLIGLLFLVVGVGLLLGIIRSQQNSQVVAGPPITTVSQPAATSNVIQGFPSEFAIPSLNMDLTVIPGIYNPKTKTWTLSLDKVQYAVITPQPNNVSGNTFIYGHYRSEVFARLHTIHMGAQAVVKTTNGHTFYYQLSSIRTTSPNDVSVFSYVGKPIMTVQTCTGLFFQNRQLFTFDLVRVV